MESMGIRELPQSEGALEFPETVRRMDQEDDRAGMVSDNEEQEPRIEGGGTIVLHVSPKIEFGEVQSAVSEEPIDPNVERLLGSTTLALDKDGVLTLRGIARIALSGLTVEEAATRVASETAFDNYEIEVTLLPLEPIGKEALQNFGYELFEGVPSTFAAVSDAPVPADYIVGPGDTIKVQLFGTENRVYELAVNRDGTINLPEIGPVSVGGLEFETMRTELQSRVSRQMIGVTASITMGELRSIQVFLAGDAARPGLYAVSSLSTMTNALFYGGGVTEIGSLRNVELKRNGKLIGTLDLYELLLNGDTSSDARLKPGDVIFVPPAGATVAITGEVRRPAIYEIKNEKTAHEVVELAGGLLASAAPKASRIERIGEDRRRTVVNVDLASAAGRETAVRNGDVIQVYPVLEDFRNVVQLSGHVYREGSFQWGSGMRLTDLLPSLEALRRNADPHYVLVRRELGPERRVDALSADLMAALASPLSEDNLLLAPGDKVYVFDLETGRRNLVDPVLDTIRLQGKRGEPTREVGVRGTVRVPGQYPLERGMRVSDLLRAGGGLSESSYGLESELTRYSVVDGKYRATQLIEIDLSKVLIGDTSADIELMPFDLVNVKEIPLWREQESVEIMGEVNFPGVYQIRRGETLQSVFLRAGGLTDLSFPDGVIFTRERLREKEKEQMEILAARLEQDLAAVSLTRIQDTPGASEALALGQSLVEQLRTSTPQGRLVVDVDRVTSGQTGNPADVVMQDGDRVFVPEKTQEVTVIGEVQFPTSHLFNGQFDRDDYINSSGGLTSKADKKRIYVVRANGSVLASNTSKWFRGGRRTEMRPGDTIVVPLDADRVSKLTIWTNVSQIIFQLGVLAAAATN